MFTENTSYKISSKHRLLLITASILLLLLIPQTVTCRPSTSKSSGIDALEALREAEYEKKIERCYADMDLNELCQRCDKITRSLDGDVYSMCCSNEDDAEKYCSNYVYYGVT